MREILSATNQTVQKDASLSNKKERDLSGEFLIEGEKLIRDAISCGYVLSRLYVVDAEKYGDIAAEDIILTSERIIEKLSETKTPQGVVAVAKKRDKKIANELNRFLVLENLQDPKNVGALLRTAAAADFTTVFSIDSADAFSPKALRASMGGVFRVNIEETNLSSLREKLGNATLLVGDMDGEDVFKVPCSKTNVAVAVGNEGNGVSQEIIKLADKKVKIPMSNNVESLNVAVSGSILMYRIKQED